MRTRRMANTSNEDDMERQKPESKMRTKQRMLKAIRMNETKLNDLIRSQDPSVAELQAITSELGEQAGELLDVVDAIWQETNDGEVESGPLWEMFHKVEDSIQESVNIANKYIRGTLTENIGWEKRSSTVDVSVETELDKSDRKKEKEKDQTRQEANETTIKGIKPPDLPNFDGRKGYSDWCAIFDAFVDNAKVSAELKMVYLKNSLSGDPLRIVERYRLTETGYTKAREELEKKYGGWERRVRNEMNEIRSFLKIDENDTNRLEEYSDKVLSLVTSLKESGSDGDLSEVSAFYMLVSEKLHHSYIKSYHRWLSTVGRKDNFEVFANWLAEEAMCEKKAKEVTGSIKERNVPTFKAGRGQRRTFSSQRQPSRPASKPSCWVCQADHATDSCPELKSWDVARRYGFCKSEGICFRCLAGKHRGMNCRKFPGCSIEGCAGTHHSLLHASGGEKRRQAVSGTGKRAQGNHGLNYQAREFTPRTRQEAINTETSGGSQENDVTPGTCFNVASSEHEKRNGKIAFQTAPVVVRCQDRSLKLNALLDPCSDASFISRAAADELGLKGEEVQFELGTVSGRNDVRMMAGSVDISSLNNSFQATLDVNVISSLEGASVCSNWQDIKQHWPHMEDVPFPKMAGNGIDLLIGLSADTMPIFVPMETRSRDKASPVAVLTPLGWTAFGCIGDAELSGDRYELNKLKNMTNTARTLRTHLVDNRISEEVQAMKAMTDMELIGVKTSEANLLSHDERMAVQKAEESLKKKGTRYQVAVPWREKEPQLTSNYEAALHRLVRLENALRRRGADLTASYHEILEDYVRKGYMTKLPAEQRSNSGEKEWFLPHFPVVREDRTSTKVRIVYDAAAQFRGMSLNSQLLPGPSLYSDLIETLIGFRQHPVALVGDVREMFLQVELAAEDQKFHRVLWRNMKTDEEPTVYEAKRWIFGNAAAPFVAQFVLQEHARRNAEEFPLAAEVVSKHVYMDDEIASFKDAETAIEARAQLGEMLEEAGMEMKKWKSNSQAVMETIPVQDRAATFQHRIEDRGANPTKTLGVVWSAEDDSLSLDAIKCSLKSADWTKRDVLREMSTVFDPLCLFAPFTLRAKMLFQLTWNGSADWDDVLPDDQQKKWSAWFSELSELSSICVPRCIHPFEGEPEQQIHVFSDASEQAYAAAVYVVSENDGVRVSNLVLARARVAPKAKKQTIPRLELMGALLGMRLVKKVCNALGKELKEVHFWSDSMDILCWIRNEVAHFQPFVAHRVAEIREFTTPSQWQHVSGSNNPADAPTRGLSLEELRGHSLWWHGPAYLLEDEENWPKRKEFSKEEFDKSEFRKLERRKTFAVTSPTASGFRLQPENYSSWTRFLRVSAWVWRFIHALRSTQSSSEGDSEGTQSNTLTPHEVEEAERFWIKQAQEECFCKEVKQLTKMPTGHVVSKKTCRESQVKQLSPFMDDFGVLRVGGRLQRSDLSYNAKHPILLPKKHQISRLVIRQVHEDAEHGVGVEHTLAELRTKYWIPAAREMVRACIRQCVTCQKLRKKTETQVMAPKLSSQVCPSYRAFDKCSVDFAGPFMTRQGRGKTRQKRYLCVFTCLQVRAVHLEMTYGMDTSSFIRALMRFIARRGRPTEITSDNGRSFVRASTELRQSVERLDNSRIQQELLKTHTKWTFIPPGAPHFNGPCEAMVKMAKRALVKTLEHADLSDEELQTAFCKAEALMNTRPLTALSADPDDGPPLTPANFITGSSDIEMVPPDAGEEASLRQRWKRIQQLSTEFWRRWLREYLPSLQQKQKWLRPQVDIAPGDVVLVTDPTAPRGRWPMGRVEDVMPGTDGHVRVVSVKMKGKTVTRPVVKLVKLSVDDSLP